VRLAALALAAALAAPLAAQEAGAVGGHVRDSIGAPLPPGVRVLLDDGQQFAAVDSTGAYRFHEVRAGWHRVTVRAIGYQPMERDSVQVDAGQTTIVNFTLSRAVTLGAVVVQTFADSVLDPLVTADVQRVQGAELRRMPVTTVQEAVQLSAGAVGDSYRGGRFGEQAFILDGIGVKNQIDASTGSLGVQVPPDMLTEASVITNGFSARYGQALSGLINVVTRDAGERWEGRAAYETDRPLWNSWDHGIDRAVVSGSGPLGRGIGLVGVLDAEGRLDADPVNAPPPTDPRDPRSTEPWILPHNGGSRLDAAGKLTVPLDEHNTLRLFGLRSVNQRLLFDPAFKYDPQFAPAQRVAGTLISGHLQHATGPFNVDLRGSYFGREFLRGTLTEAPSYLVGGFGTATFHFVGEDLARHRNSAGAAGAVPGFSTPDWSSNTPWGVPAFFLGDGSRGDIDWNRFREFRGRLDASFAAGPALEVFAGGEVAHQRVETFERALAYLPVGTGDSVPPASASGFAPRSIAGYIESTLRGPDFGLTVGLRYDAFDPHVQLATPKNRGSVSPRFAFSTVLKGATFVASWGRFHQAPDFQYLVDQAFDDTLRTGRFRRGNPDLGFETSTQWEFSLRARPTPETSARINVFNKMLDGLVGSIPLGSNADSSIFGNYDFGTVRGVELLLERELRDGWGLRVSYTLQEAQATATNAYGLLARVRLPTNDTLSPARVEFPLDYDRRHSLTVVAQGELGEQAGPVVGGVRPFARLEGAAIVRWGSGLPYSRTNATGDTLIGLPNSFRLPPQSTVDLLIRRPLAFGRRAGSVYLDVRNLLNRANLEALRRDNGSTTLTTAGIDSLAALAYAAHPEPIPFESPRYRAAADLNHDGYVSGANELMPMYIAAARDFTQPLFFYGPPRLVRLGVELDF